MSALALPVNTRESSAKAISRQASMSGSRSASQAPRSIDSVSDRCNVNERRSSSSGSSWRRFAVTAPGGWSPTGSRRPRLTADAA
jgi:hypothetical protein